jgi:lipopolysaccharide transport system permease protein
MSAEADARPKGSGKQGAGERRGERPARATAFLHLCRQLFLRDFRARYRRAFFAPVWILLPMLAMSASAIVLARQLAPEVMAAPTPYPIVIVSGLLLWGLFADSVSGPTQMCRRSRTFLRRAPFEPAAILVAATGYAVLNVLVRLPVLVAVMIWFAAAPPPQAALVLPLAAMLILLGLSIGAALAPLSLVYLDIRYGLPFVLMIGLVLTPVFFPVPEAGALRAIADANPVAHLLVAARDLLTVGRSEFSLRAVVVSAATVFVAAPLAYGYYRWGLPKGIAHI